MNKVKVNVAICYFGMTRSIRFVYKSHIENIFNVFDQNSIDFDIYMHTWKADNNIVWGNICPEPIDYQEYKLLNPTVYVIDNQNEFLKSIVFSDYFDIEKYKQYGDSMHEWRPELIRNHLCALESQKRCYKSVLASNKKYDYIMFIRPDVLIQNSINCDFARVSDLNFDIIIPNNDHHEGYNDRFAILPFASAAKYACRIDEIIDFRKKRGRIVSEKYVKYIIELFYKNVIFMDFLMTIIRPNGK